MMTRRQAKEDERALWREAMRGVTRLRENESPEEAPEPDAAPVPSRAVSAAIKASRAPSRGLDRRSAQRLKRGQIAIEARLDLHCMTQDEAHRALDRFLAESVAAERRHLLVITGKSGILKRVVPHWLDEAAARSRVLAFVEARPRDGGAGALYLRLRRR